MKGNYTEAWEEVQDLIDTNYPYPKYQGITDITEYIDFQSIGHAYELTLQQYHCLIAKAEKYYSYINAKEVT